MNRLADKILQWLDENLLAPFAIILMVITAGFLIYIPLDLYNESKEPSFSLKKDKWICTKSRMRQRWTGKFYIREEVCTQWSEK